MSSTDITDRMIAIIRQETNERRRAKELEELTGVPASHWRNALAKKQRPTCHMIELVAKQWPHYGLWLATGATDEANGHTAPDGAWGLNPGGRANDDVSKDTENYLGITLYLHYLIYGRSKAIDENWKAKKQPGDAPVDAEHPATIEELFASTDVYVPKYRDLNAALADLATQKWIAAQIQKYDLQGLNSLAQREKLIELRAKLTSERGKHSK